MADSKKVRKIKVNHERTIQGLKTGFREFYYDNTLSFVAPGTTYSVYYTFSKTEKFLTGILSSTNSKIIRAQVPSLFSQYINILSAERQKYPEIIQANPSESDYRIGKIKRYFTQKANNRNGNIFEVSKDDFSSKNNLYRYTSFQWRISGKKEEVIRDNRKTMRGQEKDYPGISKLLFPLQLWIPPKNSPENLEKKLSLLKFN